MSREALYITYRPQTFADVINQEHVKQTLQNALAGDRVGHAYLFTGPRGVGKTTIARILARSVNCENRKAGVACGKCATCKLALGGRLIDIIEIDAASNTGVDMVRQHIIESAQFTPSQGKFKVYIIDEAHMLSKGAFNALLKVLEEPPKHVMFVFATTEPHKIPATIISRTQRFDFKKISMPMLAKHLGGIAKDKKATFDEEAMQLIARQAEGSVRDAISILDQVLSYADKKITVEVVEKLLGASALRDAEKLLDAVLKNDAREAVKRINVLVESGVDMERFSKDLVSFLRTVLLVKLEPTLTADELGYTDEQLERTKALAGQVDTSRLLGVLRLFLKASQEVRYMSMPQLALELAAVESATTQKPVA